MSITTFNVKEQALGVRKIEADAVRKVITDIPNGDYKSIILVEVPEITFNDEMQEIKQISNFVRTAKNVRTANTKANVKATVELGDGYMNANEELIEAAFGKILLNSNGSGVGLKSTATASVVVVSNSNKTMTFPSNTTLLINSSNGEDAQLVQIKDVDTDAILDVGYIISEELTGGGSDIAYTFANPLVDTFVTHLTTYGTHDIELKCLPIINFDDAPNEALDMIILKGQPNSKWENDPSYMGIYGGNAIFKGSNAVGSAEIKTETGKRYEVTYDLVATLYDYIKPNTQRLPAEITFSSTGTSLAGIIYWELKGQDNAILSGDIVVAATTSFADVMTALKTDIDTEVTNTPWTHNLVVTVASTGLTITSTDNNYQELTLSMVGTTATDYVLGDISYAYTENDVWEELCEDNIKRESRATLDASHIGTVYDEWTVDFSGIVAKTDFNQGDILTLVINGIVHRVIVPSDTVVADAGTDIGDLFAASINAVTTKYKVAANNTAGALVLAATEYDVFLDINFYIEDSGNTTAMASTVTIVHTAVNNTEVPSVPDKNFVLTHLYLGDFDEDLIKFCNTATLKINYNREIQDIPCLERLNGIAGSNNTDYTITLEMELSDQDAVDRYNHWVLYRDTDETSIVGIDVNSGFSFLGRSVLVKFEEIELDGLQGHKLSLDVNYDPTTRFLMSLPQFLN